MHARNKVLGVESLVVMIVLILFAFVVFLMVEAGANAYDNIVDNKQVTTGARVAYSYMSMKIKQNDEAGAIQIVQTEFGDTLRIDIGDTKFSSFIFYAEGALYECITKANNSPSVAAGNKITHLDGFSASMDGNFIHIECRYEHNDGESEIVTGVVGLRS